MKINNKRDVLNIKNIYQRDKYECGIASLAMIFKYYGFNISLRQLKEDMNLKESGYSAKDILQKSRKYGFDAKGFKISSDNLLNLQPPIMLHWNDNHYVIYTGKDERNIYINDPTQGKRKIDIDEFNKHFSGIALKITPIDVDFKDKKVKYYEDRYTFDINISVCSIFLYTILFYITTKFYKMSLDINSILMSFFCVILFLASKLLGEKIISKAIITKLSVYKNIHFGMPIIFFLFANSEDTQIAQQNINHFNKVISSVIICTFMNISIIINLFIGNFINGIMYIIILILYVTLVYILNKLYSIFKNKKIKKVVLNNSFKIDVGYKNIDFVILNIFSVCYIACLLYFKLYSISYINTLLLMFTVFNMNQIVIFLSQINCLKSFVNKKI